MSIDKEAQISVLMSNRDAADTIDLKRIFRGFRAKSGICAWILILCITIGLTAPLLLYQFRAPALTVSSVVTLDYDVPGDDGTLKPVKELTAPDGTALDLNQVTSASVLQSTLDGLSLSKKITVEDLRKNVKIERILTENSRRQQEIANKMLEDKSSAAYSQLQSIKLTYVNQFIVSVTNGFGSKQVKLTDEELRRVLDRMLSEYNQYLVTTYADMKLPDDEISVIDTEKLDIMERLDLLRKAVKTIEDYIGTRSSEVLTYRSWSTGKTLEDFRQLLSTVRDVNVEYLYSFIYANSVATDREAMIGKYQYELREAQNQLDVLNEKIQTTKSILDNYKHDQISVTMQQSDSSMTAQITTDYYNKLIVQQATNYAEAAELEIQIADTTDKIANLQSEKSDASTEFANQELDAAIAVCRDIYLQIKNHMAEIMQSPFYTTYAVSTQAQGSAENYLSANKKPMVIGAALGGVLGFAIWFFAALGAGDTAVVPEPMIEERKEELNDDDEEEYL